VFVAASAFVLIVVVIV